RRWRAQDLLSLRTRPDRTRMQHPTCSTADRARSGARYPLSMRRQGQPRRTRRVLPTASRPAGTWSYGRHGSLSGRGWGRSVRPLPMRCRIGTMSSAYTLSQRTAANKGDLMTLRVDLINYSQTDVTVAITVTVPTTVQKIIYRQLVTTSASPDGPDQTS